MITIDFETYYDQDYSLSKLSTEEYIRDSRFEIIGVGVKDDSGLRWFNPSEFASYAKGIDWAQEVVLAHHAHFDGRILSYHYGIKPSFWLDTLSMSRALNGVVKNSLGDIAKRLGLGSKGFEVKAAKGKRLVDFTADEWQKYGRYCLNDVVLTYEAFKLLHEQLPNSQDEFFLIDMTIRLFTEPRLFLDKEGLIEYLGEERRRKELLLSSVDVEKIQLISNKKLAEVLLGLGVEPPRKTSKTTGKETFAFAKSDPDFVALQEHENQTVAAIVTARLGLKSTIEEKRAERFIELANSNTAAPVYLKYYGAHTGRWSGGDGVNWQNLPRNGRLRDCVKAPPGCKLVVADAAQIEARTLAHLAGEETLIRAFEEGRDIYSEFASIAYNRPITKADPKERFVGKTAILGLGFGMGWAKLGLTLLNGVSGKSVQFTREDMLAMRETGSEFMRSENKMLQFGSMKLRIDEKEALYHFVVADALVNKYRANYMNIVRYWDSCALKVEALTINTELKGLPLPNGMYIRYPELKRVAKGFQYSRNGRRANLWGGAIAENIVQATARIITASHALEINGEHSRIALLAHDEIVVVAGVDRASECLENMLRIMKKAPEWASGLPLSAEGGIGDTYGQSKH